VNAVLGPVIGRYMESLTGELRRLGYENEVLVLHSGGGVMTAETAGRYAACSSRNGLSFLRSIRLPHEVRHRPSAHQRQVPAQKNAVEARQRPSDLGGVLGGERSLGLG
jgi:hypothetical protein